MTQEFQVTDFKKDPNHPNLWSSPSTGLLASMDEDGNSITGIVHMIDSMVKAHLVEGKVFAKQLDKPINTVADIKASIKSK